MGDLFLTFLTTMGAGAQTTQPQSMDVKDFMAKPAVRSVYHQLVFVGIVQVMLSVFGGWFWGLLNAVFVIVGLCGVKNGMRKHVRTYSRFSACMAGFLLVSAVLLLLGGMAASHRLHQMELEDRRNLEEGLGYAEPVDPATDSDPSMDSGEPVVDEIEPVEPQMSRAMWMRHLRTGHAVLKSMGGHASEGPHHGHHAPPGVKPVPTHHDDEEDDEPVAQSNGGDTDSDDDDDDEPLTRSEQEERLRHAAGFMLLASPITLTVAMLYVLSYRHAKTLSVWMDQFNVYGPHMRHHHHSVPAQPANVLPQEYPVYAPAQGAVPSGYVPVPMAYMAPPKGTVQNV